MGIETDERILHPDTAMGAVTLRVADLERMSGYYSVAFALEPLEERARGREVHRVLGRGQTPMVRLVHTPDLPVSGPREAGLFHTAFLFDDPEGLAATVYRAAQHPLSRFVGSSDHHVSEAFYFTDPEGNGVELYTDRDRSLWTRQGGQIRITTEYLDPNAYLRTHLPQDTSGGAPAGAGRVGHVHLQVGDLDAAREFYESKPGSQSMARDPLRTLGSRAIGLWGDGPISWWFLVRNMARNGSFPDAIRALTLCYVAPKLLTQPGRLSGAQA